MRATGPVLRRKDDLYLVDCCVTGSNDGTSTDSKFSLGRLFRNGIRKRVKELVGVGGRFEGRIVVFQADSAGPHIEKTFVDEFDKMCEEEGWYKENQAPQMPHMNTCDLIVFPAMSRRHCHLARASGGIHVLKEDQIWEAAEEVWATLPNSKRASAYAHAYCIAEEVVRLKGDNRFLGERSGLSFGVRDQFNETVLGLSRRDCKKLPAPLRQK